MKNVVIFALLFATVSFAILAGAKDLSKTQNPQMLSAAKKAGQLSAEEKRIIKKMAPQLSPLPAFIYPQIISELCQFNAVGDNCPGTTSAMITAVGPYGYGCLQLPGDIATPVCGEGFEVVLPEENPFFCNASRFTFCCAVEEDNACFGRLH